MSKLTVMKYNQIVMGVLGINPHSFRSPSLNRLRLFSPFLIIITLATFIAFLALYMFQAMRLSLILEVVFHVINATASLSAYLNLRWNVDSVGQVNSRLQEIVDQAFEEETLVPVYWKAEQKCRRILKQMLVFVVFEQFAFVFALFISVYCICIGNFDTSTYYLPLKMAPPFIDSLLVWYLLWAYQFTIGISHLCGTVVVTVHFVCCGFYLGALCDHFDHLLRSFDVELRENPNSLNARKILVNAIDHHNKIYEMFDMVKEINSGTIFAFLVMSAPYLGITFHNFEHTDAEMSLEGATDIIFSLVAVSCGLMWPFLLCHYGTFATERIQSIDSIVFNADWPDYPSDLRKHIILIIAQSRSNINFDGLKMLSCNLEVFAKICKSACSYYLIFRRLTRR